VLLVLKLELLLPPVAEDSGLVETVVAETVGAAGAFDAVATEPSRKDELGVGRPIYDIIHMGNRKMETNRNTHELQGIGRYCSDLWCQSNGRHHLVNGVNQ
jgi:hypothetical protein